MTGWPTRSSVLVDLASVGDAGAYCKKLFLTQNSAYVEALCSTPLGPFSPPVTEGGSSKWNLWVLSSKDSVVLRQVRDGE